MLNFFVKDLIVSYQEQSARILALWAFSEPSTMMPPPPPHHNFVVITLMVMKFDTGTKLDVFYSVVTKSL